MTPENTIIKLIYARAAARGIEIERGSDPRHASASRGRRTVWMPPKMDPNGPRRAYDYLGSIQSIGLRLNLVSQTEVDQIYLNSNLYVRCYCGAVCRSDGFHSRHGYCGNCGNRELVAERIRYPR